MMDKVQGGKVARRKMVAVMVIVRVVMVGKIFRVVMVGMLESLLRSLAVIQVLTFFPVECLHHITYNYKSY